jgi:hypothetical protein
MREDVIGNDATEAVTYDNDAAIAPLRIVELLQQIDARLPDLVPALNVRWRDVEVSGCIADDPHDEEAGRREQNEASDE